jgi:hypothetical protein
MHAVGEDAKRRTRVGGRRPLGEPLGPRPQRLVCRDLHEQRRQAGEVGVKWRDQRAGGIRALDTSPRELRRVNAIQPRLAALAEVPPLF